MKNYEKKAFVQIFLGYFISVSIFILLLGFLYFQQQKTFIMQQVAMNMHQFLMKTKESKFVYEKENYQIDIVKNAEVKKQLPVKKDNFYIKAFSNKFIVKLDARIVDKKLLELKNFTIILLAVLIFVFAIVSWVLTKLSLKPMVDIISHLDRFTKDLVHDLNTPVTSILLNTKMLQKNADENSLKKITRIENSAKNISSLYANLEVLLDGNSLIKKKFNLSVVIEEVVETYKSIYPNIIFNFTFNDKYVISNQNAIKRILDNIISNACKYSGDKNPTINITYNNGILTIQDNGKGIKYPKKIFERSYRENENGHGIGMHIVHRLCSELAHKISIESKEQEGTIIILTLH